MTCSYIHELISCLSTPQSQELALMQINIIIIVIAFAIVPESGKTVHYKAQIGLR
jgi:hypothetical protein